MNYSWEEERKVPLKEIYGPAMQIEVPKEAQHYLRALVKRSIKLFGQSEKKATQIAKTNLGYYAGYYSDNTRARVEKLFGAPDLKSAIVGGGAQRERSEP